LLVAFALFIVGCTAGFVDAIAGGGGLLTVPALLLTGLDARIVLGTNKGQSVFGSGMALHRYSTSALLDRPRARQSFVPALVGAALGVACVSHIDPKVLTPLVMALLAAVAVLMIFQRPPVAARPPIIRPFWMAAAVGFILAFYDGFFGPGAGTFLILAYAWMWHDSLDSASANAKVVNFASNLASMVAFALPWGRIGEGLLDGSLVLDASLLHGSIVWTFALPMAAGQLIGGFLGAHATIRSGRTLVRYAVVAVSIGLLLRMAWGML
jgi:uncharacterized membrane protein YfcA